MKSRFVISMLCLVMSAAAVAQDQEQEQEPVWEANTVELRGEKLADGVYAIIPSDAAEKAPRGIPIARSGGFVVGQDGVLVIDTMLNKRLAHQVQDIVASVTDKPIRYIVNTSFHGDHSYGNSLFPDSAVIIQSAVAKDYVDNHFTEDTEFMIGIFGAGRGIEEAVPKTGDILIPTGGSITLDLGGRTVLIRDFGFAQTGGDLFVWLPGEKVLWTGNPVVAPAPALPWLLDGHLIETLETMKSVYAFVPKDAQVVPGHGPVTGTDVIKWHIDYLTAVHDQVSEAVAEGLTLEATVARVTLPEFAGYQLFGWVHPALNVPAAYKDLSGTE